MQTFYFTCPDIEGVKDFTTEALEKERIGEDAVSAAYYEYGGDEVWQDSELIELDVLDGDKQPWFSITVYLTIPEPEFQVTVEE